MRRSGLLNPALASAVSRLGHTHTFVVADCGLPIPRGTKVIDLTVTFGIPRFEEVLGVILGAGCPSERDHRGSGTAG